jgi:predicted nucleic acid-binding Zn ribbon protein
MGHYASGSPGYHRRCPQGQKGPERRRGAEGIADLVARAVKQAKVGDRGKLGQLRQAWREVVGRQFAEQSWVTGLKGTVLTVEVTSAALGQELSVYHKHALLKGLTERTGLKLSDLRCRVSGRKPPAE